MKKLSFILEFKYKNEEANNTTVITRKVKMFFVYHNGYGFFFDKISFNGSMCLMKIIINPAEVKSNNSFTNTGLGNAKFIN